MSTGPRTPAGPGEFDAAARASMMARVQEQLTSRHAGEERRCPLCSKPIRGGQASATVHGTTVHARCRRAAR